MFKFSCQALYGCVRLYKIKVKNDKCELASVCLGFNQGIRLLVMGLGQILGPLWAASFLNNLPIMAGVNLAMVTFVLVGNIF